MLDDHLKILTWTCTKVLLRSTLQATKGCGGVRDAICSYQVFWMTSGVFGALEHRCLCHVGADVARSFSVPGKFAEPIVAPALTEVKRPFLADCCKDCTIVYNVNCMCLACEFLAQVQWGCGRDVSLAAEQAHVVQKSQSSKSQSSSTAVVLFREGRARKSMVHSGSKRQEASSNGAVALSLRDGTKRASSVRNKQKSRWRSRAMNYWWTRRSIVEALKRRCLGGGGADCFQRFDDKRTSS